MSKQYLKAHTVDNAHIADIFALAPTPRTILSAGASSTIAVHDVTQQSFPIRQTIKNAHPLGCHHMTAARDGRTVASAGFGGEVRLWGYDAATGEWSPKGDVTVTGKSGAAAKNSVAETWALALSEDGKCLVTTTYDGRLHVYDVADGKNVQQICCYETGGGASASFGMCVDISRDGRFTASGHQDGSIYVFNNETRHVLYSLAGLSKPVRTLSFSPKGTRLVAAGDAGIIAMYDMHHGEHVGTLTGHGSWVMSVDWSETGEWLLSSGFDGRVKVWSVERMLCVATHSETDKAVWAARWLPKTVATRGEMFCAAGANRSLTFYREATGV